MNCIFCNNIVKYGPWIPDTKSPPLRHNYGWCHNHSLPVFFKWIQSKQQFYITAIMITEPLHKPYHAIYKDLIDKKTQIYLYPPYKKLATFNYLPTLSPDNFHSLLSRLLNLKAFS